jgi:SAM-dependent methyltransferase
MGIGQNCPKTSPISYYQVKMASESMVGRHSRAEHMQHAYRYDLAYIHDAGFGHLAASAAPVVIEELKRAGTHSGTVVDLGCGSGITSRLLCDAGYEVVGIDLSEPLIEMARKRVPDAAFRMGSFTTADIPPCVAVMAIGEVFNYIFDTANSTAVRAKAFDRIYAALAPGGLLVFDMADMLALLHAVRSGRLPKAPIGRFLWKQKRTQPTAC